MKRLLSYVCLCMSVLMNPAQADLASRQQLTALISEYQTFKAKFNQATSTNGGRSFEETSGELWVAKPNQFRWESQEPFPQTIVNDGKYVWVYDPDLEQATRRPSDTSMQNAAAMILGGRIDELAESFDISANQGIGEQVLFELTPKDESDVFKVIRLFFNNNTLSELLLEDSLGQRTTVAFFMPEKNIELDDSIFIFTPPEGTDIIVEDTF
ncbi:MAG: outer membrane lipoprotein chaperone LolA [Pontibacterium sp.]